MEFWKAIEGTKGFIEVSNKGRVRSWLRGYANILKTQPDKKGYHRIRITIEREKMSYKVHREVAKAFLPNPNQLPQVNHKDGNKDNNAVENLEWVTNTENARHAMEHGLWDNVFEASRRSNEAKKRAVLAVRDSESIWFKSICEAQEHFDSRHICDVLKGKRQHVKGWSFKYAEEVMLNADIDYRAAE